MYNTNKEQNEKHIKQLIEKEGYTDLGWANNGKTFSKSAERRTQPIREVDCSLYSMRGTHKVYVDDVSKEILHVDSSD